MTLGLDPFLRYSGLGTAVPVEQDQGYGHQPIGGLFLADRPRKLGVIVEFPVPWAGASLEPESVEKIVV